MRLIRFISMVLILLFVNIAAARLVEGVDPYANKKKSAAVVQENLSTWDKLKKRVAQEWKNYKGKETQPASQAAVESPGKAATNKSNELSRQDPEKTVTNLQSNLPSYNSEERKKYQEYIEKNKQSFGVGTSLFTKTNGKKADINLPKNKSGIPVFSLTETQKIKTKSGKIKKIKVKVTSIPSLNIGEESKISKNDLLLQDYNMSLLAVKKAEPLKSPERIAKSELKPWLKRKIKLTGVEKKLKRTNWGITEVVTQSKIEKISLAMLASTEINEKPVQKQSKEDLEMLAALLLYGHGNKCHQVAGLFHKLSKDKKYKDEANFYLGQCAFELGFYAEGVERLLRIVKLEHSFFTPEAIGTLAKNISKQYEKKFSKSMLSLKNKSLIKNENKDRVNYLISKGIYKSGKFNLASNYAGSVSESSKYYPSAQYLKGISQYALNNKKGAEEILHNLQNYLEKKKIEDKNLKSLLAVNLARIQFSRNQFKSAYKNYMKIDKTHALWVQGLVEQGWTQIMLGDYPGAIGNMYSLHSPYFKGVYMPESYAVRSIGYLNICQYGDAYSALTKLERQYGTWNTKVERYIKSHKLAKDYYFTVFNYLRGNSQSDVDGLPYQIVRELGRRRYFLNQQEAINLKVDETAQYKFILGVINNDKAKMRRRIHLARQRLIKIKADIKSVKKNPELSKHLTEWKQQKNFESNLIASLNFQLGVLNNSTKGYNRLRTVAKKRIDKEVYGLREQAGKYLVKTMSKLNSQMGLSLENNEFLRYEVYAGSGENIRYQVAGGKTTNSGRIPASIKPPKSLNWQFEGEYWEDEIGAYRSTLKNNCPNRGQAAAFNGGQ